MHHLSPLTVVALATTLSAQSIVVPNANASTRGTAQLNTIIRNAGNPRTYQYGVNAAELAGIPIGATITGVSLRFQAFSGNSASWPPADITWTNYDIWVGPANPTASWVADPFANFTTPPQQVRSGPMTLDANTYTNTSPPAPTPNAWGEFFFDFQNPFLYLGGDLGFLFSHPGSTDATTAQYPETVVSDATTYGVGRTQSVYPPGTATAGTTFYVMRLHYGFGIGCPGSSGTPPVLVQNGDTTGGLGGNILLQIGNAPANTATLFALGVASITAPLGNGCTLLIAPAANVLAIADGKGRSRLTIAVPPGITGSLFVQGGVLDAAAPGGFTMTNSVQPTAN